MSTLRRTAALLVLAVLAAATPLAGAKATCPEYFSSGIDDEPMIATLVGSYSITEEYMTEEVCVSVTRTYGRYYMMDGRSFLLEC